MAGQYNQQHGRKLAWAWWNEQGITSVVSTEATETGTRRETGSCRPKWSPIPTTADTWIPVSEPRGKLSSGHLSGVGFGWYLARISLQLVPACWCSYPLVVRRDFAFFPCVFCVCSLRFLTWIFHSVCVHFRRHIGFAFSLSRYFCF